MNPEKHELEPQELTPNQEQIADTFIALFELEDQAETKLEMAGHKGTLRYGIGRCAHHLGITDPNQNIPDDKLEQLHAMIMAKLEQQKES